jgi:hypothetical protein
LLKELRTITQEAFPEFLGAALECSDYGRMLAMVDAARPFPVAVAAKRAELQLETQQPIVLWNAELLLHNPPTVTKTIYVYSAIHPQIVYE